MLAENILYSKDWDYTILARTYDKRAEYNKQAIDFMYQVGVPKGSLVADIGAGTAKLAKLLLEDGFNVDAVEPNDEMRAIGASNTEGKNIRWLKANSHDTTLHSNTYDLVTFGSSFNVADRTASLEEVKRIAKNKAWFACMWNHRDVEDPLQKEIEDILKSHVPHYDYGMRRENQSQFLEKSGVFSEIYYGYFPFVVEMSAGDCYEAWESHGTLAKEALHKREQILHQIKKVLEVYKTYLIPYATRIWVGKLKECNQV